MINYLFLHTQSKNLKNKIKDYSQLAKFRLSATVVFSSLVGYLLACEVFNWLNFLMLFLGGFFVVASSNGFNQVFEKKTDKLMSRTQKRPIPSGRLEKIEGLVFSSILGLFGILILYNLNFKCAIFGLIALIIYVMIYTPLKKISPIAVFVGALPGASPFMIGWIAYSNEFSIEALTLFAIQFLWQFPHFWSIAWILDEDYKKAGINMLPSKMKDENSAFHALLYTIWLIPVSIIPFIFPYIGIRSELNLSIFGALFIFATGLYMYFQAYNLLKNCDFISAKKLMIGSLIYLPTIQIIYLIDKYLIL